ncbi:hypothetical protein ASC66_01235 [Leifsonia sp. Root4]|uniref:hypothetical protein n=1 Tax=Leifsonia sp. Root4 TaxID=1736525 RepID=UPI0006FB1E39|nr:hypothetical protein [Leifsonia sp. Root4]KQW07652.1 hypothetical protein ASC66_01235 [Leifsonia sp. Root4]
MSTPTTPAVPADPIIEPTAPAVEAPGATPDAEPLGAPGLAALKSEREAKAAAEKRAAAAEARVKEFEDRDKSESEKQAERLAEFERENAELRSAKTRSEVAAAKGVPAALLTGSTQEELEASANALVAFRGEPAKPSAAPFIENTNKTTVDTDFDSAIEAARSSRNFALVATLRQQKAAQTKG